MQPLDNGTLLTISTNYITESKEAKRTRMEKNKFNFDMYNLNQDFSDKITGQSQEFLPKLSMAIEQNANFLQQGLVDLGDWFSVEPEDGFEEDAMKIRPSEIYKLLSNNLSLDGFVKKIGDAAKLGMLGSLLIAKVHGKMVPKYKYKVKKTLKDAKFSQKILKTEDKAWQLAISLIRHEDFHPDPTGRNLYCAEDMYMDYHEVEAMAKGPNAIYDLEAVKGLRASQGSESMIEQAKKARETGQNVTTSGFRNVVKLTEFWGNIINSEGELVAENVMWTIANDSVVIQEPIENPFWHGENPYVFAPLLSTPFAVWPKALADAPASLNQAINEFFNLMLDGGLMSVHGIKQIKEHYLEDPSQVEDGITAGDTLRVKANCPPGESVLSRVDTSSIPTDGFNMINMVNQEFYSGMITSDLRMGLTNMRAVKATEVVESSNANTSMLSGMVKQIEGDAGSGFITRILIKSWQTIAQHTLDLDENKLKSWLSPKRAEVILGMSNEELFVETVQGCKFKVFGISALLNKQKEFTKIQAFLQTVAGSPVLMEEFLKKGYSFGELLTEIMRSLDINTAKLKDKGSIEQAGADSMGGMAPEAGANMQSQIPQAGAAVNQGDLDAVQSQVPRAEFPPSRATSV